MGEQLSPVEVPAIFMVLVNPGVPVPTGLVFSALDRRDNNGLPDKFPHWPDADAFGAWLRIQRNDLEPVARRVAPQIDAALERIGETEGCLLARMSGSGATCFGLYADRTQAERARQKLASEGHGWWIVSAGLWARPD